MMHKPEEYGVSVRLVQEGQDFLYEARVTELPDVRTYGETFSEAYSGAIEVIAATQRIFAEKGKTFPEVEQIEDEFSGRVTLRMSKSLHRCVHEKAARDGVSLNHWIVEAVGFRVKPMGSTDHPIFVASPMRQPQKPLGLFIQPAVYMTTLATPAGAATVFGTAGVVEGFALAIPWGETQQWRGTYHE